MNESRDLASFLTGLKYTDLPNQVVEKAEDLVLDQLGVQLATSTKPWSVIVFNYIKRLAGPRESTIVNYGKKVSAENAAFANGAFGHGFEIDDMYPAGSTHPGPTVVPPALALGEREKIDGKTFLTAVVAGYEAHGRVARSVTPTLVERGFHPISIAGPFGSAVVAGRILGFDDNLMLNALSIGGSQAAGLMEYSQTGGSVKRMHAGMGGAAGIRAAFLAKAGLTGPPTILEGEKGFGHAFAGSDFHPERLADELGKEFIVNSMCYKRHCCCYPIHAAIDATLDIVKERNLKPDDIQEIIMGTNKVSLREVGSIQEPIDITGAQFSAYFTLAMAVVKGSAGFHDYTEENLKNPDIRQLASRISVELDNEVHAIFPARRAVRLTIKAKDGRTYHQRLEGPKGTPQNPISREEVRDKFRGLATLVLPEAKVEQIIKMAGSLDGLGDISRLAGLLVR